MMWSADGTLAIPSNCYPCRWETQSRTIFTCRRLVPVYPQAQGKCWCNWGWYPQTGWTDPPTMMQHVQSRQCSIWKFKNWPVRDFAVFHPSCRKLSQWSNLPVVSNFILRKWSGPMFEKQNPSNLFSPNMNSLLGCTPTYFEGCLAYVVFKWNTKWIPEMKLHSQNGLAAFAIAQKVWVCSAASPEKYFKKK